MDNTYNESYFTKNIWGHYIFISAGENNSTKYLPVMSNNVDRTC